MTKTLNLGAGNRIFADADNHDFRQHRPEINLVFDLNTIPYPIKDETYDKVLLISVIEHLIPTPIQTLNEIWRIMKFNGILDIKYPLWDSPTIHDDPTHRWFLSPIALDVVDPSTYKSEEYGFYTPYKWHIIEKKQHKDLSMWMKLRKISHG